MIRFSSCMAPNMESVCRDIARLAAERLGIETAFVGDIAWQEREARFRRGEVDVLWICGLPYVWNWQDDPDAVQLLAAPVMQGERYGGAPVYYSDIVVRRASGLKSFEDLRGTRFVYNEPRSHSGYNVVRHHLAALGHRSGYFGTASESGAHQRSLAWILEGEADVAAIDSTVLELEFDRCPGLREAVSIIDTLGPSPMPPWLVRSEVDAALRDALRRLLLSLHEDREGRAVLDACRMARFATVGDADFDPIRRMAAQADGVVL